jgi:hypothetical protein
VAAAPVAVHCFQHLFHTALKSSRVELVLYLVHDNMNTADATQLLHEYVLVSCWECPADRRQHLRGRHSAPQAAREPTAAAVHVHANMHVHYRWQWMCPRAITLAVNAADLCGDGLHDKR